MYIELHSRSAFSFLEGASLPEDLIATCTNLSMPAMAGQQAPTVAETLAERAEPHRAEQPSGRLVGAQIEGDHRAESAHLPLRHVVLRMACEPGVVDGGDARVQLAVDRANADLVSFLSGLPRASHVVVNSSYLNEHVFELPLHLSALKRRPDIMVEHVSRLRQGALPATDTFVATPQMEHEPVPTVRIGLEESGVRHVNATLSALLNGRGELVYHAGERTRVLEVGLHRLLCRARVSRSVDASYCPADRGVIYRRTFVYGWQVHRLKQRTGDRERAAGRPDLS